MALDRRVVCPQDVKKILLRQARLVGWKTWAAKHEWGVEGRSVAGADPSHAAKKAPRCDEEAGRRMGSE